MRKKEAAQLSKDARIESVSEVLEILMLEPDGEMMLHGSGICFSTHALSKDRWFLFFFVGDFLIQYSLEGCRSAIWEEITVYMV